MSMEIREHKQSWAYVRSRPGVSPRIGVPQLINVKKCTKKRLFPDIEVPIIMPASATEVTPVASIFILLKVEILLPFSPVSLSATGLYVPRARAVSAGLAQSRRIMRTRSVLDLLAAF